jgi:glycosyltransferase involved in cell wall biosynthesis
VQAFIRLLKARRDVRLIVVGDGPYLAEMKEALKGFPATFTGFLSGEDLPQTYASSDLFVFPSTTDTFGNVVLEAQASGLPVIVTDQGGPKENLLHGKTGMIVPANDAEAMAGAILTMAEDTKRMKAMGQNARTYMQNRGFEAAYLQLWDSYSTPVPGEPVFPFLDPC